MRIREFETGIFYGMGPLLGFTKYNANAVKIDPYWGSIFGWSLMVISEKAPDFLKEWLLIGWHFGRGVVPW